ncbi:hypothetical protein RD792_003915 [Penstemon davidsonii]|uniref:Amino acid transporter transmembrane domain-containing protein n=1 Tax=Penstemon davidsonii TaxID=160366 RepID=A0ABR0DH55_9LAMI|nr:hypothetical protein RD792_003915 [Penstemon davidsonii]
MEIQHVKEPETQNLGESASRQVDEAESQNQLQDKSTTFIKTCLNGLNVLSGVGTLSVSFALSEGGWLCLIAFFLIAIICFYTGVLIKRCMDSNPLIRTYPDIGEEAFGRKGRIVISIFMYVELFLVAVEFLIMEGDNLHKLFPKLCVHIFGKEIGGKKVFIILTALVMLPTTWLRSLSLLAYISIGGAFTSFALIGVIFWIGEFEGVGFSEKGVLWRWNGVLTSINMFTFCYLGHAVFPTLYSSMKDKKRFPKVLIVCFALSTISYGSMAVLGYLMYGENVMPQVTLNLPTKKISSKVAIYMTLITPITKYALIISPIAKALEEKLNVDGRRRISLMIRSTLVIITAIMALVIPFFEYVMAFIGAFLGISASILFPCVCYLKIVKASRHLGVELIFIAIVIVVGLFVGSIGTYISIRDIVNRIHKY